MPVRVGSPFKVIAIVTNESETPAEHVNVLVEGYSPAVQRVLKKPIEDQDFAPHQTKGYEIEFELGEPGRVRLVLGVFPKEWGNKPHLWVEEAYFLDVLQAKN